MAFILGRKKKSDERYFFATSRRRVCLLLQFHYLRFGGNKAPILLGYYYYTIVTQRNETYACAIYLFLNHSQNKSESYQLPHMQKNSYEFNLTKFGMFAKKKTICVWIGWIGFETIENLSEFIDPHCLYLFSYWLSYLTPYNHFKLFGINKLLIKKNHLKKISPFSPEIDVCNFKSPICR